MCSTSSSSAARPAGRGAGALVHAHSLMLVVITTYGIEATRLLRAAGGAGARDRAAAIVFAYDAGLVTPRT